MFLPGSLANLWLQLLETPIGQTLGLTQICTPCEHPTLTLPSATHERLEWTRRASTNAALSQYRLTAICCVCGASSADVACFGGL